MVLLSIIWMGSPIRTGNKRKIFAIIDVIIHLLSFFHSYFTDQERFSEIGSTGIGSGWWWLAASLKSTDFGFGWQLPNTTWETLWIAIICQSKLHQHVLNQCMGVLDIKLILRASSFIVSQEYRTLGDLQTWDLSKNLHDRRYQDKKFTQKTRNFSTFVKLRQKVRKCLELG